MDQIAELEYRIDKLTEQVDDLNGKLLVAEKAIRLLLLLQAPDSVQASSESQEPS
jgi:hypothetical protein